MRRPVPHGAQNIGTWHTVLDIISRVAVVTNVALVVFTSNLFEDETMETKLLAFLLAEHAVFLLQYMMSFIPDVPLDVTIQLQRQVCGALCFFHLPPTHLLASGTDLHR